LASGLFVRLRGLVNLVFNCVSSIADRFSGGRNSLVVEKRSNLKQIEVGINGTMYLVHSLLGLGGLGLG